MTPLRILVLTRYGELGASSRMRFFQYLPILAQHGFQVEVQPLFDDDSLSARYSTGHYKFLTLVHSFAKRIFRLIRSKKRDLIWIEKEALPWWPQWFESALLRGVPYVLDFDDAVFHNYDLHRLGWVRQVFGKKLDRLMANATLVVCGNYYLANRAKVACAPRVEVLPTVIDLKKYADTAIPMPAADFLPRIVWIGSPSTACYLEILREPLLSLSQRIPFVLRVIGAHVEWSDVNVECLQWTSETEVSSIARGAVGVMPLLDSAWERGKCGYKLIQYMACGLAVVASPVGVNNEIVEDSVNGFLAAKAEDWVAALEHLLTNAEVRTRMGQEGKRRVMANYCLQATAPRMIELLQLSSSRSK